MNRLYRYQNIFFKYKRKLKLFDASVGSFSSSPHTSGDKRISLKLLFFGSDNFSLPSLIRLNQSRETSSVISQLDVVTRGDTNPVRKYAKSNQLTCYKWPIAADVIREQNYDVGVVVSFGHMIPEDVINAFPLGMINVHGSLLPRWRGASPIIYSVLNEDPVTGLTIMKIRPKHFDVGEVLAQREVPVPPNVLMPELYTVMAKEGADLLTQCMQNLPECLRQAKPQSNENVSYAPRVTDAMAKIDWTSMTGRHIFNLYRALYSFKNLKTTWHGQKVKIIEVQMCDSSVDAATHSSASIPGSITYIRSKNSLQVHCADESSVEILKLQLEGRKVFTARDFNNGYLKKAATNDRYFE